ncbi:MAG: hypothetical protein R3A79_09700 [Nannocystaceae bacterium]
MATWIVLLHLLMPSIPTLATVDAAAIERPADEELGPRYPGVERLFAKFDREAAQKR